VEEIKEKELDTLISENSGESEKNEDCVNTTIDHFKKMGEIWGKMSKTFSRLKGEGKKSGKFTKRQRDIKSERQKEKQRRRQARMSKKVR
jgi:hypothetical protein